MIDAGTIMMHQSKWCMNHNDAQLKWCKNKKKHDALKDDEWINLCLNLNGKKDTTYDIYWNIMSV